MCSTKGILIDIASFPHMCALSLPLTSTAVGYWDPNPDCDGRYGPVMGTLTIVSGVRLAVQFRGGCLRTTVTVRLVST